MIKKIISLSFVFFSAVASFSQESKFSTEEIDINPFIPGTLYTPEKASKKTDLIILIAGSGPTDRNGNQLGAISNCLKFLAEGLAKNNFAVYNYDKRPIVEMRSGKLDESKLSFDPLIQDVKDIVSYFKAKKQFHKIIIAGHSEGSLIGMNAALPDADAFISLAGAGRPIDEVLVEQIGKRAPMLKEETAKGLELLKKGETFEAKNPMLAGLFRASVQPYMISWLKHNPQEEIKKLQIPILIINGTKDIQIPVQDAELLHNANPKSELVLIENMNHIFKEIKGDETENMGSYTNPNLPVMPQLIEKITTFLKKI
ncbi:alpha/beta hydrolase [Flavobacterium microcysteis]|uniref:Alpha/beta hydrolase n=1 Tax=Flavobacterium microcysteis TaxID=2596891 RepID=A0A501QBF3_9FLAO|nr:alpha/beta hydrolase [Flavobacterium microcysteis]TPD69722.1 alpha/beta hydrolase [Flavobacterium microcysteis]